MLKDWTKKQIPTHSKNTPPGTPNLPLWKVQIYPSGKFKSTPPQKLQKHPFGKYKKHPFRNYKNTLLESTKNTLLESTNLPLRNSKNTPPKSQFHPSADKQDTSADSFLPSADHARTQKNLLLQ